ncbi:unnamed protein product, partial [Rotaria sordida]
MLKNHLIKNDNKNSKEINFNSSVLQFIKSNNIEKTFFQINKIKTFNSNSFLNLLNEKSLINSFECENDLALGAGEYSFLIYGGQYLTLYNIDGQLKKISWNTNLYDSIKQIRWSSYHRSYLIMTARLFTLLTLFSYELIPIKKTFQSNEQLQLFTCYQTDLWLVYLLNLTKKQK